MASRPGLGAGGLWPAATGQGAGEQQFPGTSSRPVPQPGHPGSGQGDASRLIDRATARRSTDQGIGQPVLVVSHQAQPQQITPFCWPVRVFWWQTGLPELGGPGRWPNDSLRAGSFNSTMLQTAWARTSRRLWCSRVGAP